MASTKKMKVFKCEVCGNMVEVLQAGKGELVCCNQPMKDLEEKTQDEGNEKHLPVIEKTAEGYKVSVGSVEHPMEEEHFIQWIELIVDDKLVERKHLSAGEKPQAEFCVVGEHEKVESREYCNLHGLWKA